MVISERIYPVDFKQHFFGTRNRISSEDSKIIAEKYKNGCSLRDLAKLYGYSKSKIRSILKRQGLKPRIGITKATRKRPLASGKQGALPYYGFWYFEGQIVKDPREFPILQMIHRHWSQGKSIHQINLELNRTKVVSRKGKAWSWAHGLSGSLLHSRKLASLMFFKPGSGALKPRSSINHVHRLGVARDFSSEIRIIRKLLSRPKSFVESVS